MKKIELNVYQEDVDWLMQFSKIRDITTPEDAIHELIKKEFGAKYLTIHFVEWREEE